MNEKYNHFFMNQMVNAIQLCFKTLILGHVTKNDDIIIKLGSEPDSDKGFEYFQKIVDGEWNSKKLNLIIKNFSQVLTPTLLNFLMLTRLQDQNMKALVALDAKYLPYLKKIFGESKARFQDYIENLQQLVAIIFSKVEKEKLTLRELSHKTNLSQVALSNFKAGKDIRLSSLIKILNALKLKILIRDS